MDFQNLFNDFVRMGGTNVVLMLDAIKKAVLMPLNKDRSVENKLRIFGRYQIKNAIYDSATDTLVLNIDSDGSGEDRQYSYTYGENDFVIMDMGKAEDMMPESAILYEKYARGE